MKWTRKEQECEGSYYFNGAFFVTKMVSEHLGLDVIHAIYADIQNYVRKHDGADYLFVYESEQGDKLFCIDQLNKEMIASGEYLPEHNYATLMYAHEYGRGYRGLIAQKKHGVYPVLFRIS